MKKITLDEEIELTEQEEKIYKKGEEEGFAEGAGVVYLLFVCFILVAAIIQYFYYK